MLVHVCALTIMAQPAPALSSSATARAVALGGRLRTARLRQRTRQADLASASGISTATLRKLENGDTSVSLAALMSVLDTLGMGEDVADVAATDPVGRSMLDDTIKGLPRGRRQAWAPA